MSIETYPIVPCTGNNDPSRSRRKYHRRSGWHSMPLLCSSMRITIAATFLLLQFSLVASQHPSSTPQAGRQCSCSPLTYKWILNFTNPCPPADVAIGPKTGIDELFCDTYFDTKHHANVTDDSLTPVIISSILLLELDDSGLGAFLMEPNASLVDGDVIEFTSDTKDDPDYITQRFLAEIIGMNAAGESVALSVKFILSNTCGQPPFMVGDSIGWLTYGPDVPFRPNTCDSPTPSPSTSIPTITPTSIPTITPTKSKKSKKSKTKSSKSKKSKTKSSKSKKSKTKSSKSKKSKTNSKTKSKKSTKVKKSKASKDKKLRGL